MISAPGPWLPGQPPVYEGRNGCPIGQRVINPNRYAGPYRAASGDRSMKSRYTTL
jgi:hypothetical protein